MNEDSMIVKFTSTAPLPEKDIPKEDYIMTWEETYPNGVIRRDLVHFSIGDTLTCDSDQQAQEIRVISNKRETLEIFFDVMGIQETPEIHRAEIGVTRRKED